MNEIVEKIKILAKEKTLLYVEDNDGLRENMSKLLVKIFGNVILAQDGQDGYSSFVKNRPNIVLTDINMPKLNGFEMLRKMKATEPDLKVIVLSALDEKNIYIWLSNMVYLDTFTNPQNYLHYLQQYTNLFYLFKPKTTVVYF